MSLWSFHSEGISNAAKAALVGETFAALEKGRTVEIIGTSK